MVKERLVWIDALKGWLILLVVLGHSIQYCMPETHNVNYWWNLIYSFHMPAFFAVSGYLNFRVIADNQDLASLCIRRSKQLLIPYLLWSSIKWLLLCDHTGTNLINIIMKPDSYFWFLWVLWVISLVTIGGVYIYRRLRINQDVVLVSISLAFIGIMVMWEFRFVGFQFVAYYFIFYVLGLFCNKYKRLLTKNRLFGFALLLVWLLLGSFWNMHDLPVFLRHIMLIPSSIMQYSYRIITAIVAIYLLLSFAPLTFSSPKLFNQWIAHLGQLSLGIYVVHLLFISPLSALLIRTLPDVPAPILVMISFLLSSLASYILVELLNKNMLASRYLFGKLNQ